MQYLFNSPNAYTKILKVSVGERKLHAYVLEAEKYLSASLSVKGFRKGKVPLDIARKHLDKKAVLEQALERAVQRSFSEVLTKETDIELIETSDFKIIKNTSEQLEYEMTLTIFPPVKLGDYETFKIEKKQISVEDGEVEQALDTIRKSRATFEAVDRPARIGDKVEIDFFIKENGMVIEGGESKHHPFVLGEGKFIKGFEDNIVGMKAGEKKSFDLTVPRDYHHKAIAGKTLSAAVTVHSVEQRNLPKLDDAFAAELGSFQTVAELTKSVREGLRAEKEAKEKERVRLLILEKLSQESDVVLPPLLVDNQLDKMIADFDGALHQRGLELSLYLAQIKKTQDELRAQWRKQAEKQVKNALLIREIAKKENIIPSQDEVETQTKIYLQQYQNIPDAQSKINPEDIKRQVARILASEKVLEFLEKRIK